MERLYARVLSPRQLKHTRNRTFFWRSLQKKLYAPHSTAFRSTPSRSAYHIVCCSSGTSAVKIRSAFLPCKVPRNHCVSFPATSLTISSVGAAYMPPAHLFLDRQCNLPSPCRGRACLAGAISVSKNHILALLNV